jgi:hypothetical protein
MAKREKITPPPITEELLREAAKDFRETSEIDRKWAALFKNGKTKQKNIAVGKALLKLRDAWGKLSAEEREWFFEAVNTPKEATKLLLGAPDDDPYYDMSKQPHEVMAKLDAACEGYKKYLEVAAYKGNRRTYRHKATVDFLMRHWEQETKQTATFYRNNNTQGQPIELVRWVEECLKRLKKEGLAVEPAQAESRVEKVYQRREKPKKKHKATN